MSHRRQTQGQHCPVFCPIFCRYWKWTLARCCVTHAYLAAKQAEHSCGKELTDRESFVWLEENGAGEYKLPMFDNYTDYLTKARKATGEQRKTPRPSRTGRSVVKKSEL